MNILPIKLITETDQAIFGSNLFNLGKLARLDLPIPEGLAVSPPEIFIRTVLKHADFSAKEIFEQRLAILKDETKNISLDGEFSQNLKDIKNYCWNGKVFNKKESLWRDLINFWLDEIRSIIRREGFRERLTDSLTPQGIFFLSPKITASCSAYFDPDLQEVVIKSENRVEPKFLKELDELVLQSNKKLFLPQVYRFLVVEDNIYIVGTSPFTQTLPASQDRDVIIPKNEKKRIAKSAIKLFLNISSGFAIEKEVDGILIEGERINTPGVYPSFEDIVFKLSESALSFPVKPVIYKLPDVSDGDIRGTLRLLNQKNLLDQSLNAFSFVREKKGLYNVELAAPFIRSEEELVLFKRELGVRGITGKGILRLWLEFAVPENILNLEDYLTIGFGGVILNLDEMQKSLGGYGIAEGEFYKRQVATAIKFVKPIFKILHKAKLPTLIKGELAIHPDMLECLIEEGAWGLVANTLVDAQRLPEHLMWAEHRFVQKKFL